MHANDREKAFKRFYSILTCNNCPEKSIKKEYNLIKFFYVYVLKKGKKMINYIIQVDLEENCEKCKQ